MEEFEAISIIVVFSGIILVGLNELLLQPVLKYFKFREIDKEIDARIERSLKEHKETYSEYYPIRERD